MVSPPPQPPNRQLLGNLVRFGRLLRRLGLATTMAEIHTLIDALDEVAITSRRDFREAARTILVHRREHLGVFDYAFDLFWTADALKPRTRVDLGRILKRSRRPQEVALLERRAEDGVELAESDATVVERRYTWSARELLRRKDFAELSDEEAEEVRRLMRRGTLRLAPRRTRRRVPAPAGKLLDLRSTLRQSLRYGGEVVELAWRRRKTKRRPLVVLCDVSGSMELYSRLLLQFVYTLKGATDRLEAFVFGTRLTRITRQLRTRDVDRALADATAAIADWGGGTRIGESLKAFNFDWARRVLGQGAVVAVISDGWDRGELELLEREVARLRRHADRLIWLNPLLGSEGYEPLTRGIRAVLPYVDDFLPVHNLESLEQLARLLERLDERRPRLVFSPPRSPQGEAAG